MDLSLHRSVDNHCASDNSTDQDCCSYSSELCDKNVDGTNTNDINLYWNFIDDLAVILQYPVIDQLNNIDLNPSFVNNLFDGKQFASPIETAMNLSNNSGTISSSVVDKCKSNFDTEGNGTIERLKLAAHQNAAIKAQPKSAVQLNAITKVQPESAEQPNARAIISTKKRQPVSRGKDLRLLWQSCNVPSSSTDVDNTIAKSVDSTPKAGKRRKGSESSNGRKRQKSTKSVKSVANGNCTTIISTTTDNCIGTGSTNGNDVSTAATTTTTVLQTQYYDTSSMTVSQVNQHQEHPIDNEPRYCFCNRISYGQMIACDNSKCPIEWFHFPCVNLAPDSNVNGDWYCPPCQKSVNLI